MNTFTDPPESPDAPGAAPSRNQTQSVFTANFNAAFAWLIQQMWPWTGAFHSWFATFKAELQFYMATVVAAVSGGAFSIPFTLNSWTWGDPGAGKALFNHATLASVTAIHLDQYDAAGIDVTAAIGLMDSSTSSVKGWFRIEKASNASVYRVYAINGGVTTPGSYSVVPVVHQFGAGAFAASDALVLKFTPNGDKGDTGAAGSIDAASLASTTHAATSKATPVDADEFSIADSAASWGLKKVTLAALKAQTGPGDHHFWVHTGNGRGSVNTRIRRFTTTQSSAGSDVVYADSSTLGASGTIATGGDGLWEVEVGEVGGTVAFGISVNTSQPTVNIDSVSVPSRRAYITVGASQVGVMSIVLRLAAGDVVRPHCDDNVSNTTDKVFFKMRKVGL